MTKAIPFEQTTTLLYIGKMRKITIAIDGFSSCGKSTMAKDLAREIGYIYIDSGAMYRAVTLYCIENGLLHDGQIDVEKLRNEIDNLHITFRPNTETNRPDTYLNGMNVESKIRTMEVSSHVSPVAALDFVREAMVKQQQEMKQRDYIDQHREVSPLRKADDALLLDNSHLTIEQQKEWLAEQFARVAGN